MRPSLAILCAPGDDPGPRLLELAPLVDELEEVLLAAVNLDGAASSRRARVASLYPARGLAGALHAALTLSRSPELLVVAADRPVSLAALRALAAAPPGGAVLHAGAAPLPARYRRACLGALTRVLAAGEADLAALARRLHASRLRANP